MIDSPDSSRLWSIRFLSVLLDKFHRERDHRPTSATLAGSTIVLLFFRQFAEVPDVLLGHAQLHGFLSARQFDGLGHAADTFGSRRRDRHDRGGFGLPLR